MANSNETTYGLVMNEVAAAFLGRGLEYALEGFWKFCGQRGQDADELFDLFQEYYYDHQVEVPEDKAPPKRSLAKKAAKKTVKKVTSVEALPQAVDGITVLKLCNIENDAWCKKVPLSEFKKYSKERGLPVSGTKAQLISNLIKYEKAKVSSSDGDKPDEEPIETTSSDKVSDEEEIEEFKTKKPSITVKKPKRSGKKQKYANDKLAEPESREMVYRNGYWMVKVPNDDKYLIMSSEEDDALVIGYVEGDDIAGPDDEVDVRPLTKKTIQIAQKMQLTYDIPDNLDV
jgi:hypothetical protein